MTLDDNKITDKGFKYIARALKKNTSLTELYFDDNDGITDQALINQVTNKVEANLDATTQADANKIEHKNNEPSIVKIDEMCKPSAPPLPDPSAPSPSAPPAPAGSIIDEIAGNCQNTNDPQNEDGIEAAGVIGDIPGGFNW